MERVATFSGLRSAVPINGADIPFSQLSFWEW